MKMSVESTATKRVRADRSKLFINLRLSDKDITTLTEKYNKFYTELRDLVTSVDNTACLSVTGLQFITDETTVKSLFGFFTSEKSCYAMTSITVIYNEDEMYNKVFSHCESYTDVFNDKKSGSCFIYSCSKVAFVSEEMQDKVREELIGVAVNDAYEQALTFVEADNKYKDMIMRTVSPGTITKPTHADDARRRAGRYKKLAIKHTIISPLSTCGDRYYRSACLDGSVNASAPAKQLSVEQGDSYTTFKLRVTVEFVYDEQ